MNSSNVYEKYIHILVSVIKSSDLFRLYINAIFIHFKCVRYCSYTVPLIVIIDSLHIRCPNVSAEAILKCITQSYTCKKSENVTTTERINTYDCTYHALPCIIPSPSHSVLLSGDLE